MPFDPFTIALGTSAAAAALVAIKVAGALGIAAGSSLYAATVVAGAFVGAVNYQLKHSDEDKFAKAARVIRETGIACSFTLSIGTEGSASHYHFEIRDYDGNRLGLKFLGSGKHTFKKLSEKFYVNIPRGSDEMSQVINVNGWYGAIGLASGNFSKLIAERKGEHYMIESSLLAVAVTTAFAYRSTSWGVTGWVTHSDVGGIWVWPSVTPTADCPYTGPLTCRIHAAAPVFEILLARIRFA